MATSPNLDFPQLESALKSMILQETEKDHIDVASFTDDEPLFGPESRLELDSLDALQITVALQAQFKVRLNGDRMVRKHMMCIRDLAAFVRTEHSA